MYFFKHKGKQYVDFTGDLLITQNDNAVKARFKSAAPENMFYGNFIEIPKLNFKGKLKATFFIIKFIWGGQLPLVKYKTPKNDPYMKNPKEPTNDELS